MDDEIKAKGEAANFIAHCVGLMHTRLKRATELLEAGHVDAAVVLADASDKARATALDCYAQHFAGEGAAQAQWWVRYQYRCLRSLEALASEDAVIDASVALSVREHLTPKGEREVTVTVTGLPEGVAEAVNAKVKAAIEAGERVLT